MTNSGDNDAKHKELDKQKSAFRVIYIMDYSSRQRNSAVIFQGNRFFKNRAYEAASHCVFIRHNI